ncbi:MAG: hypothetical protein LUF30_12500, partial [Lachnospiraceae bacterium]|nr:hypothetical protein [Lachnospiraceae bacterium]
MKKSRKKKERKILILLGSLLVCVSFPGQRAIARSSGAKTMCEKWLVSLDRATRQETLEVTEMESENEAGMNAEAERETESVLEAEVSQNEETQTESG